MLGSPDLLVANTPIVVVAALGVVLLTVAWWAIYVKVIKKRRLRAEIDAEVAAGRTHRAVLHYLELGRFAEAAELEEKKGNLDNAADLFERAGDLHRAAQVFVAAGDHEMAALVYKSGGSRREAAQEFAAAGRPASAAALFEEVGDMQAAATEWRKVGDLERAAGALERSGRHDEAAPELARLAEARGKTAEAAKHWESAGEVDRALELYRASGELTEAARVLEARGDFEAAAGILMQVQDFPNAARLYVLAGDQKNGAHAFFRAGDMTQAVHHLGLIEDWVTMAGVFVKFGHRKEAKNALRKVPNDSPGYKDALVMLAEIELQDDKPEAAYQTYDRLVKYAVATRAPTKDETRGWIMAMADILFVHDKRVEGLACIKRLGELGLMTPEIREKLRAFEAPATTAGPLTRPSMQSLAMPQHERYEFVIKLGQGGNGVIYKARDRMLGREICIKMIGPTALSSQLARKWFLREAQTAAKLNHPNIVTIYDLGEHGNQPYIAMELVDGETLAEVVDRDGALPMQPKGFGPICEQLCGAMSYAHNQGVVHRDIKLENIMLTRASGDVKLMDFGLAKAINGSPDKSMVISGTPAYMSPEQIVGTDIDHRTDIYSLGVMIFLLMTGYWPYADGNILEHHRFTPVPDPRSLNTDLPRGFTMLVERCMAKDPNDRFGDAQEVYQAFQALF